ncbi:LysR family transcriptional regulator [Aneurinibacillus sp. REN35]|uniref:LysR family transcriptional regulator n=1 Tax=Aneurinibacillus sp. REN35 TaxID=3237286 RepID=UPI0035289A58
MEDRDWVILKVLYEEKNITKAAQRLFMSQPSLTKQLRQIEEEFALQIVKRGRRGVHFTPQGEYLARCANDMTQKLREIAEAVRAMENDVAGTLRLGVSNYFTRYKLPRLLKLFQDQYPRVEFKVNTGWSREMGALVANHEVHVGFVRGEYKWSGEKLLLFTDMLCIASRHPIDKNALPQLPRIDYKTEYGFKTIMDHWWMENYTEPPSIVMEVDQVETCKEMVRHGLGYAIMPRLMLEDAEDIHTIDIMIKKGQPVLRKTWMLYHKESLDTNVVRAFIQFMEELHGQNAI